MRVAETEVRRRIVNYSREAQGDTAAMQQRKRGILPFYEKTLTRDNLIGYVT